MSAIGTENYYEKRGKWRKIANLEQSRMLLQFARVVPEGREFNRVPEYIMERVVQQSINGTKIVHFFIYYFFNTV
jgi:hypothetical protein